MQRNQQYYIVSSNQYRLDIDIDIYHVTPAVLLCIFLKSNNINPIQVQIQSHLQLQIALLHTRQQDRANVRQENCNVDD